MSSSAREKYASMGMLEKLELVDEIRILHPGFMKAIKLIEECHTMTQYSSNPFSLLIVGPSGTGKSTVFEHYVQANDRTVHGDTGTKKVILWGEIPNPTTIKTVLDMLLGKLGVYAPQAGTLANKNMRLINLIKDCGIELIMLDEFQHFYDPKRRKVLYDVSEWFKSIVNHTKIPIILFGLEACSEVLDCNPQLSRRFPIRYHFGAFTYNTDKEVKHFRKLLQYIDDLLPFEEPSDLADQNLSDRIFYATDGIMDSIMMIIRRAAKIAIEKGKTKIESIDLAQAFHALFHVNKNKDINPFIGANFSYRQI